MSEMATTTEHHARHRLIDELNSPVRFSVVAALASVDEAEFGHVRDTVEISDSVLSRQAYRGFGRIVGR